jgi:LacI family transcriptional regulator
MLDVARAAGVSKNAVSLALRNDPQIPTATRNRIAEVAERLGYTKNPTVGHLMAQLRLGAAGGHKAALALLNANESQDATRKHPTIPTYVAGCRREAERQGYGLDEFWLHDPKLDGRRLCQILRARSIRGVIVTGLMNSNELPERYHAVWENFACVVTGVRTRNPSLSFSCTDHHILALRAFEKALQLGYKRPALVLERAIDHLVEGRFSGGVLIAQQALAPNRWTTPFYDVAAARSEPELFLEWLRREKPDCILTLYHTVRRWVEQAGMRVPQDIGLIQLEWRKDHGDWAGMHQHNDEVGEAAVEMIIGMIHRNQIGVPEFPRATLIGSSWVDGKTVSRRSGRVKCEVAVRK